MNSPSLKKALILAAGEGTRLLPLTKRKPKPLFEFYGIPALYFHFAQLKRSGIEDIAINSYHLADQIIHAAQTNPFALVPKISVERDRILGTGGALLPLSTWMSRQPAVIINGDIVANISIDAMLQQHVKSGALATMMLLPLPIAGETVVYAANGLIKQIGDQSTTQTLTSQVSNQHMSKHCFACAQIIDQGFYDYVERFNGSFSVIEAYRAALREGQKIGAFIHEGFWADIGNPQRYFDAHVDYYERFLGKGDDCLQVFDLLKSFGSLPALNPPSSQQQNIIPPVFFSRSSRGCGNSHLVNNAQTLGPNVFAFTDDFSAISASATFRNCVIAGDAEMNSLPDQLDHAIVSGPDVVNF